MSDEIEDQKWRAMIINVSGGSRSPGIHRVEFRPNAMGQSRGMAGSISVPNNASMGVLIVDGEPVVLDYRPPEQPHPRLEAADYQAKAIAAARAKLQSGNAG